MDERSEKPPVEPIPVMLDYAEPPPPISARRVFAGLCGVIALLVAVLFTPLSIGWMLVAIGRMIDGHDRYIVEDWKAVGTMWSVAIPCAIAARRWLRFAGRPEPEPRTK